MKPSLMALAKNSAEEGGSQAGQNNRQIGMAELNVKMDWRGDWLSQPCCTVAETGFSRLGAKDQLKIFRLSNGT